MEGLNKQKGVFLSNEINVNLLTPTQWSGIIIAMGKYAKFYHEAMTGTDSGEKNGSDAREFSTIPCCRCGSYLTKDENNQCRVYPPSERICDKCVELSKSICPICHGDKETYGAMGFSVCRYCVEKI
jgi:hypothetical protein